MEADFWHERWAEREIGFHQQEINSFLQRYWSKLELPRESRVLVPLCGKSTDMVWLAQQGHSVIGVELSEMAVQEFFEELKVAPAVDETGPFKRYAVDNIELLVGDFFALTAQDLADVAAVYDRAALVALPPEMRRDYAKLLTSLLPAQVQALLITFEYRPGDAEGPPFSIAADEVDSLFQDRCNISKLDSQYFDLRGVDATEHAFHLSYR